MPSDELPSTSFLTRQINSSTFLVVEDDAYGELPYIYAKLYPNYILITDTGCDSPRCLNLHVTSLRQYLETYPVSTNRDQPLNPNGSKEYLLLCTHCHYDHILGIPQFLSADPKIIASSFEKSFLRKNFPEHSLCKHVNAPTPSYAITEWARHMDYFSISGAPLRIQFLHTPGHTPDSLSWFDLEEQYLYVGDTFYERYRNPPILELPAESGQVPGLPSTQAAIIFPEQGNWVDYMASLSMLLSFVRYRNAELGKQHDGSQKEIPKVKVGCGHMTYDADAERMILQVQGLFERIIAGKVPVLKSGEKRGIIYDHWCESEESKYSVTAPRSLVEDARRHFRIEIQT